MGKRAVDHRWNVHARAVMKRRVLALLARGMEEHEIIQNLSSEMRPDGEGGWKENRSYTENPRTGKPYSQETINRVIHEILDEWSRRDAELIKLWRGELVGHNKELERAFWGRGDLRGVLSTINQRAQLVGGFAPSNVVALNVDLTELTHEELERIAAGEDPSSVISSRTAGASDPGTGEA